jgi:hypothetical protein
MVQRQADSEIDARRLAGLLADEKRLRVAAALALGANTLDGICHMTGLEPRAAGRALGQLLDCGLVEDDSTSGLRLRRDVFRSAARGAPHGDGPDSLASLVPNGRLPRSREQRLAVLGRLATLLEPGYRYPEEEVNARLGKVDPDYALLRRSLVDEGFLMRASESASGGRTVVVYWRTGVIPAVADDDKV